MELTREYLDTLKNVIEEIDPWTWTKTIYIWYTSYWIVNWMRYYIDTNDLDRNIWQIEKIVQTVVWDTTTTERFKPADADWLPSMRFIFNWTDRATLTYI